MEPVFKTKEFIKALFKVILEAFKVYEGIRQPSKHIIYINYASNFVCPNNLEINSIDFYEICLL